MSKNEITFTDESENPPAISDPPSDIDKQFNLAKGKIGSYANRLLMEIIPLK